MFAYIDITGYLERVGDLFHNIASHTHSVNYSDEICKVVIPRLVAMLANAIKMISIHFHRSRPQSLKRLFATIVLLMLSMPN